MSFNIPKVNREEIIQTFKKHLINTVILRMDFADIFDSKDFASKVVAKLASDFPERGEETEEIFGQTEFALIPIKKIVSYILKNNKNKNYIKINQNSILIECKTYENFNGLLQLFNEILSIYFSLYPNNNILRIGLRKINFYDKEEKDQLITFEEYFNDSLLPELNKKYLGTTLSQDIHSYIIKGENNEGFSINFRYGSSVFEEKEKKIRRFILDIDGYSFDDLSQKTLIEKFKKINDKIFDVFYFSIGDKIKGELKV